MKQGKSQASSAMATKDRLLTSSDIAVMVIMVMAAPTVFGIDNKLVCTTLNPRPRNERDKYWPTGYFGIPNKSPRAYKGHMS